MSFRRWGRWRHGRFAQADVRGNADAHQRRGVLGGGSPASPEFQVVRPAAFFARPLSQTFGLLADTGYEGAEVMVTKDPANRGPVELADLFSRQARRRVEERFAAVFDNDDLAAYAVAQQVIRNEHTWLEQGMARLADER